MRVIRKRNNMESGSDRKKTRTKPGKGRVLPLLPIESAGSKRKSQTTARAETSPIDRNELLNKQGQGTGCEAAEIGQHPIQLTIRHPHPRTKACGQLIH